MYTTRLTRNGNSTSLTLPRDLLDKAHLERGDEVVVEVHDGKLEISKSGGDYNRAMEVGRAFAVRYRHTMAALAK